MPLVDVASKRRGCYLGRICVGTSGEVCCPRRRVGVMELAAGPISRAPMMEYVAVDSPAVFTNRICALLSLEEIVDVEC